MAGFPPKVFALGEFVEAKFFAGKRDRGFGKVGFGLNVPSRSVLLDHGHEQIEREVGHSVGVDRILASRHELCAHGGGSSDGEDFFAVVEEGDDGIDLRDDGASSGAELWL